MRGNLQLVVINKERLTNAFRGSGVNLNHPLLIDRAVGNHTGKVLALWRLYISGRADNT